MAYPKNYPGIKQGVRLLLDQTDSEGMQLTAVVDRVDDEEQIELGCMDAKRASALRPNMAVTVEYFREGAIYKMRTSIQEVGPLPEDLGSRSRRQIVVSPPREISKIQRRRFTRVIVPVMVYHMKIEGDEEERDLTTKKGKRAAGKWAKDLSARGLQGYTETLSGSGLRMRTTPSIRTGDHLYLRIELPNENVEAVGEVVWMGTRPPQEVPGEAVGVDFKSIDETGQQAILDFIEGRKRR